MSTTEMTTELIGAELSRSPASPKEFKGSVAPDWCPGCGDFGVLNSLQRAVFELLDAAAGPPASAVGRHGSLDQEVATGSIMRPTKEHCPTQKSSSGQVEAKRDMPQGFLFL